MYFMTFARHSGEAGAGVCGCLTWLLFSRSMLSGTEKSPLSVSYLSVLLGTAFLLLGVACPFPIHGLEHILLTISETSEPGKPH